MPGRKKKRMGARMPEARTSSGTKVSTKTPGIDEYDGLKCRYCEAPVSFVSGYGGTTAQPR